MKLLLVVIGVITFCGCEVGTRKTVQTGLARTPVVAVFVPDSRLPAAQLIFKQSCASCHAGYDTYQDSDWVNTGLVVPGQPKASPVFMKLSANGGDMPVGNPLSASQLQDIETWITQMPADAASADPSTAPPATPAMQRALAAATVLSNRCVSCHTATQTGTIGTTPAFGAAVTSFLASKDLLTFNKYFVQNGPFVIEGNADASWIYQSLKQYGDIGSMPSDGSTLGSSDAAAISTWINGLAD